MTGDRVTEIRDRLDAATPGPWFREYSDVITSGYDPTDTTDEPMHMRIVQHAPHLDSHDQHGIENAELIANAPADLAYLLDALASWEAVAKGLMDVTASRDAALARVEALHRRDGDFDCCTTCYNLANDGYEPWPCPTIAALSGTNQEGKRDE